MGCPSIASSAMNSLEITGLTKKMRVRFYGIPFGRLSEIQEIHFCECVKFYGPAGQSINYDKMWNCW